MKENPKLAYCSIFSISMSTTFRVVVLPLSKAMRSMSVRATNVAKINVRNRQGKTDTKVYLTDSLVKVTNCSKPFRNQAE